LTNTSSAFAANTIVDIYDGNDYSTWEDNNGDGNYGNNDHTYVVDADDTTISYFREFDFTTDLL